MSSRTSFAYALALALAATTACAPAAETDDAEAAADEVIASSASVQVIRHVDEATRRARVEAFIARNGEGWAPSTPGLFTAVNRLTGAIVDMRNGAPYGPDVTLTAGEASAAARAFLQRNADLLGLTAAELGSVALRVDPIDFGNFRWAIGVTGESRQPGYEAFDVVARRISMSISIGRDGTVRVIHDLFGSQLPRLTLSTEPRLAADDPRTLAAVVGTELVWFIPDPSPYDAVDESQRVPLGRVEASDVAGAKTTIHIEHREATTVLRLAWQLEVKKPGDRSFFFTVDATTGRLLDERQATFAFHF